MTDTAAVVSALDRWLRGRLEDGALEWLDGRCAAVSEGNERALSFALSALSRHAAESHALDLSPQERDEGTSLRPNWEPAAWTLLDGARARLLLSWPAGSEQAAYVDLLDRIFGSADVGELVSLYRALPLLPHAAAHQSRCAEGIRTNMTSVFCAVAHRNPYPREHLDEAAWNQMVLKALFVGVDLHPIQGLDERANPALARMLCHYAHERWAAHRKVSPELWRCVGPFADAGALKDLERVLREGDRPEIEAATLALRSSPRPEAAVLLEQHPLDSAEPLDWSRLAGTT